MLAGVSQEKLASALGITYQQVQKYENGTNRVSASRLYRVSKTLKVPASYFFDGIQNDETAEDVLYDSSDARVLVREFEQIKDPAARKQLVNLTRTFANKNKG